MNQQKYKNAPLLLVILIFSFVCNALAQQKPVLPYLDKNVCPFPCGEFGKWMALSNLRAYQDEGDTSHLVFTLSTGDSFQAITGNMHTERAGVLVLTKPITFYNNNMSFDTLKLGDTLYTLNYLGEGMNSIWYRGKILLFHIFRYVKNYTNLYEGTPKEEYSTILIRKPRMIWWLQVKNATGQIGWIRFVNKSIRGFSIDEDMDGMGHCG